MTAMEITALITALGGLLTPVAVIFTAVVGILTLFSQRKTRLELAKKLAATDDKIDVVQRQNDGMMARLSSERDISVLEARTATEKAHVAEAATLVARAEGVENVREAVRQGAETTAAITEGAAKGVAPYALEGVKEGAREAVEAAQKAED